MRFYIKKKGVLIVQFVLNVVKKYYCKPSGDDHSICYLVWFLYWDELNHWLWNISWARTWCTHMKKHKWYVTKSWISRHMHKRWVEDRCVLHRTSMLIPVDPIKAITGFCSASFVHSSPISVLRPCQSPPVLLHPLRGSPCMSLILLNIFYC